MAGSSSAPVTIGQRCFVGTRSVWAKTRRWRMTRRWKTSRCCRAAENSRGRNLARFARETHRAPAKRSRRRNARRFRAASRSASLHTAGVLIFPLLVVAAIFPGIIAMNELNYADDYYWYLFLSPFVALVVCAAAGAGDRRRQMAAAGPGETGTASAARFLLFAEMVRGPDAGLEPRHSGPALRVDLSAAMVSAARREARQRRRDFHGFVHFARSSVHRRGGLHRRRGVAGRGARARWML